MPSVSGSGIARPLRLKDFDFGFASANAEASDHPELLLRGYLDHSGVIDTALHGKKFLFLGYKGSGKSALGEHLVLASQSDPQVFTRMIDIADLSFQSFSQIMQRTTEPEARYPTSWSWLLMLQFLDSFSQDNGSNIGDETELALAVETLKDSGLLPNPELSRTVQSTLEMNLTVKLSGFLELGGKKTSTRVTDLPFFVERLKLVSSSFRSTSKHIIVVDGFDDLLRRRSLQYDALGALIFEANRINGLFSKHQVPAKLILLCRTDLFERLPGPNNNKIRQDYAITLDWRNNSENAGVSPLVQLINHRASLKTERPVDIFREFLPLMLERVAAREQLLRHTRQVPRDMVMLFKYLQEFSGDEPMTAGQVFDALAAYSKKYFVQEIKDELNGQIDGEEIVRAFRLFSGARKRVVRVRDLEDRVEKLRYPDTFDLDRVLKCLFDCSAIGNCRTPQAELATSVFKFRNPYAMFDPDQFVVFHRALWEGLDLH